MISCLLLVILWTGLSRQAPVPEDQRPWNPRALRFNSDGVFKISIFGDLHFGEPAAVEGPPHDRATVGVINKVLETRTPDLVVLNGDLITGEDSFLGNATDVIDQMVRPMLDRKLPWASTYGNHDNDFNISGSDVLRREKRWPNSLTRKMIPGDVGVTNYFLPVYPCRCTGEGCAPDLLLWFFDSRGGYRKQERQSSGMRVGIPNWVDKSVVEWFKSTNARFVRTYRKEIPSLAFVHIPPDAFRAVQSAGIDPSREPGINHDEPLAQQADGGGQDAPFMKAIAETPGMIALFSGHDHGNSWCSKVKGKVPGLNDTGTDVHVCFGQHSGYSGYSSWVRGARQLSVKLDKLAKGELDTWIQLETGQVVGSVTLNSTYGKDRYPVTSPNETTHLK